MQFRAFVRYLWRWLRPVEEAAPIQDIHLVIHPGHPLRNLARVVWMILGVGKKEE